MIVIVVRVFLLLQHFFYFVKGYAYLAVFVIEDNQHFIVIHMNAVQEHIDHFSFLFFVVKVGQSDIPRLSKGTRYAQLTTK